MNCGLLWLSVVIYVYKIEQKNKYKYYLQYFMINYKKFGLSWMTIMKFLVMAAVWTALSKDRRVQTNDMYFFVQNSNVIRFYVFSSVFDVTIKI